MAKKDYAVPIEIQSELAKRTAEFSEKNLPPYCRFYSDAKGKFIYLLREYIDLKTGRPVELEKMGRLTYDGNTEDMEFAIFKYSSNKYDPNEFLFPGAELLDGTIEGALKACLKVDPVQQWKVI